jgi:hypothetical protein
VAYTFSKLPRLKNEVEIIFDMHMQGSEKVQADTMHEAGHAIQSVWQKTSMDDRAVADYVNKKSVRDIMHTTRDMTKCEFHVCLA